MDPAITGIEDKILLKKQADKLGIPRTELYYGAHKRDFDFTAFSAKLEALCTQGVDGMLIKATHLSWSAGLKVVRGWQNVCKDPATLLGNLTHLAAFIQDNILSATNREADAHLNFLEPGVTVE